MLPSRIAVTTDFSAESRQAFAPAAALAKKFSAELLLVHLAQMPPVVLSPWPEVGAYILPDDIYGAVEKRLVEMALTESAFAGLRVRPLVVRDESVEVLADTLASEHVQLLVTPTHGYSGLKRFLLGSFADRVIRAARCPVLVFRGDVKPDFEPRRVYVAHDFSVPGKAVLAVALDWARVFRAKVRLHFVVEQSASLYEYASDMRDRFQDYLERVRGQALERFGKLIREDWKGVEVEASATVGQAAEEILREAGEFEADLIVLGTHSRTVLERVFLGSVARKVVTGAPVPVLTIRG